MSIGIIIIAIFILILLYNLLAKNLEENARQAQYKLLHQEVTTFLLYESSIDNTYLLNKIPNPTAENCFPDKLLGKIKFLTEKHFTEIGKNPTNIPQSLASDYDDINTPHCKIVKYNEQDKVIKLTLLNEEGATIMTKTYEYCSKNLISTEYVFEAESTTTKFYYDDYDILLKNERFLTISPNSLFATTKYKYDNLGNCIKVTSQQYKVYINSDAIIYYFNESELKSTWVKILNNHYELIAHNFYKIGDDQKITLNSRIEYENGIKKEVLYFDLYGKVIKKIGFEESETSFTIIYEYNEESIAINTKEYDRKNCLVEEIFCDDKGNKIKVVSHSPFTVPSLRETTFEYIYDIKGNWIERKKKSAFDNQIFITRREILYYP